MIQLLIGLLIALLISILSYRLRLLTDSGALAAAVVGTIIFGLGGFAWALLLLFFFFSSSGFSKLFQRRKTRLDENYAKGSQRDAGQVLANGGVAAGLVLLHALFPQAGWIWAAFAASLAAANADTWGTELGVLSPVAPRLIGSFKPVERGASGGVTWIGTLAALAGSFLVALLAVLFWQGGGNAAFSFLNLALVTLCGLAGSLVDSLLGATVQVIYYCPNCHKETERHRLHSCGATTAYLRGWRWLDNDLVNTACTLSAALLAIVLVFSI